MGELFICEDIKKFLNLRYCKRFRTINLDIDREENRFFHGHVFENTLIRDVNPSQLGEAQFELVVHLADLATRKYGSPPYQCLNTYPNSYSSNTVRLDLNRILKAYLISTSIRYSSFIVTEHSF